MRTKTGALMLMVLLVSSGSALAQDPAVQDTGKTRAETELSRVNEILKIIGLPGVAEEARELGVPEEDVKIILEEAKKRRLPPAETEIILQETGASVRESGPVDNFGAFVQSKLGEGLRGRDLATAIHEEHRLHGKGQGHGKKKSHGKDKDRGKGKDRGDKKDKHPEDADRDDQVDRDDQDDQDDEHDDDDDEQEGRRKTKGGKGK